MFSFFKKVTCDNCKKELRKSKTVNYAGKNICSEKCMIEYFKGITTEELIRLDQEDRK